MFFFFKQKTAYEMRISDWSSDVCSSDLAYGRGGLGQTQGRPVLRAMDQIAQLVLERVIAHCLGFADQNDAFGRQDLAAIDDPAEGIEHKIGRASCRERVWQ